MLTLLTFFSNKIDYIFINRRHRRINRSEYYTRTKVVWKKEKSGDWFTRYGELSSLWFCFKNLHIHTKSLSSSKKNLSELFKNYWIRRLSIVFVRRNNFPEFKIFISSDLNLYLTEWQLTKPRYLVLLIAEMLETLSFFKIKLFWLQAIALLLLRKSVCKVYVKVILL